MEANGLRRLSWLAALALLAAPAAGSTAVADASTGGGQVIEREVTVRGVVHRVAVRVPDGYDAARAWPLVVFLHGSGECGTDGVKQTRVGLEPAVEAQPSRWPCLVLMPQKPSSAQQWEEHEDLVLAAIADVRATWHIDPDRIALTGLSQGGHGTWVIGTRHPELFSCLAPVCGYGDTAAIAPSARALPVWAFHGLRDDVVDPAGTTAVVEEIRRLRRGAGGDAAQVRLTLYPGAGHNSWDAAYAEPDLPGWLLGHRRAAVTP
jgi:predicted peptidase